MAPGEKQTDALDRPAARSDGCVLKVIEGDDKGAQYDLSEGRAVIGSDPDCQLRMGDSAVSGQHAAVEVGVEGLVVTDLGSRNGTYYLESRLERAVLPLGAVLRMGRSRVALGSRQKPSSKAHSDRESYGALFGASPAMRRLYATLEQLEPLEYTTLLLGETGVGKDLVAREIHKHSIRQRAPFEVCDCASLSATLIESELFGHVPGAFTGAKGTYAGAFERANGGTIFLDEIGELPLDLQPKLLRVLETKTVRRVGSGATIEVDVRVIAATNRDLGQEARDGKFRKDLFFRLNLASVTIPPLRTRREDIPELVRVILKDLGHDDLALSPSTIELFTTGYDWPGNIRELRNAVMRALTFGTPDDLGEGTGNTGAVAVNVEAPFQEEKKRAIDAFERDYLTEKLRRANNNIAQAARDSNVERTQFKRLLRKHGLIGLE
jgi:two-component system, NtrC family, nitrogen regulation response regulator GlnG